MKRTLEFYCNVLGLPLVGLFRMHGVKRAVHAFVELEPGRYLSFIHFPSPPEQVGGTTHAEWPGQATPPATMQHLALHLDTEAELADVERRLRNAGYNVTPPIDHGFCKSIYLAGPDSVCLELTINLRPMGPDEIEADVVERCGISEAELAELRAGRVRVR